jgi:acyl-CoA thioesterase-1
MRFIFWQKLLSLALSLVFLTCQEKKENPNYVNNPIDQYTSYRFLALGDSYTIGESVCDTCRWPAQLKTAVENEIDGSNISVSIIAQTGWTTTNLLQAISEASTSNNYNLVSLLIGVNNQYQGKPFSLYETEFVQLLDIAIAKAGGDKTKVIVVSIPDYAFTPFGQSMSNPSQITTDLINYNAYASSVCNERGISFVNITDITQEGLNDSSLVATDGLHPSEAAYALFVERLLPVAKSILID